MKIEAKKILLTQRHKLVADDFYSTEDGKLIIKRTGIDKLEKANALHVTITSITTVPYSNKCCTTIMGRGTIGGISIETVASANPDNCRYHNYAEVAIKRLRHRLLLMLLDLYEHNIFSDEESDTFEMQRAAKDFRDVASEARKMVERKAA